MKRLLALLLVLAMIGCAQQPTDTGAKDVIDSLQDTPKTPPAPQTPPAAEPTPQPPAQTTTEPVVTTEPPREPPVAPPAEPAQTTTTGTMDPKLKDLLKRSTEKLKSYQYLFGGTETRNLFLDTYYVKDDMIKIKKYSEDYYVRDGYYDTIYVNLDIGCCEELSRCRSHNVDNTNVSFEVVSENLPKTPMEWVKEIPASAKIVGPQTFNERSVTFVTYDKNGYTYDMLIDDTYGIPHRVIVRQGDNEIAKYQFNDLKFNQLKDADFDPPCD